MTTLAQHSFEGRSGRIGNLLRRIFALLLGLVWFSGSLAAADLVVEGEFHAGTSGNEYTVYVENESDIEPLNGVTLSVIAKSPNITIDAIEPAILDLTPYGIGTFTVTFSIAEDAPAGASELVTFGIDAEDDVAFDRPNPVLVAHILDDQTDTTAIAEAIAACRLAEAENQLGNLEDGHPEAARLRQRLDETAGRMAASEAALGEAQSAFDADEPGAADRALQRAGDESCEPLHSQIVALQGQIDEALAQQAEQTGPLVAAAESALASCNPEIMIASLDQLSPLEASLDDAGQAVLAALHREVAAREAFTASKPLYLGGDLPGARASLAQAQASQCADLLQATNTRIGKIDRLEALLAEVESTRTSCDPARIDRLSGRLGGQSHVLLTQARSSLEATAAPLHRATSKNSEAKPAYLAGRLGQAEGSLIAARAALDGIGPGACPSLRETIDGRLEKINRLRAALARAEQARQACDIPAMRRFIGQAGDGSHSLLREKANVLRNAITACESDAEATRSDEIAREQERERQQERQRQRDQQARTQATHEQACAAMYDGGVLAQSRADGSFRCDCPSGRYLHEGRGSCMTWDQVVADARSGCQRDGGSLVEVRGPEDYSCCPAGTAYYEATNSCWGQDDLVADAQQSCAAQGAVAAQINGPEDYICCPRGTTRYDAANNTCYDDNRIAEEQRRQQQQQAAEALQGLGALMQGLQGLSGQGGYTGGGNTGGGYTGGNTGTQQSTNAACNGYIAQLRQHGQRVQSLTMQYQSMAGASKSARQAKACELFRENLRGHDIMETANRNGCTMPAWVSQYRAPVAQSVANNC